MDNTITNEKFSDKINRILQKYPIILQILRFAAIGIINTALDFLVLNFISKTLNISAGLKLGQVNVISFSLAVVQSYFWNRYWAFSTQQVLSLWKNFVRLVLVGALGALAVILVLVGAKVSASPSFYLIILLAFVIFQLAMWIGFGLSKIFVSADNQSKQFIIFLVVSIIGLIINSVLLSLISQRFALVSNPDLNKNLAKILATFVSLVWNFIGYKIFVFKK
jgi:putative flippase GtrA